MNTELAVAPADNRQATTAESPPGALVLTPELSAELAAKSAELESAHPREILAWAVERFGDKLTMATAFGPEGMVIIHYLAQVGPRTNIFNLDTGYQFDETLELREKIVARYGIAVDMKQPDVTF